MAPPRFPTWVQRYRNIPYLEGGRTRAGLDCWGLVTLVWREEMGVALPSHDGLFWAKGCDMKALGAQIDTFRGDYDPVPAGEEQPLDGVLLRLSGQPIHIGLVVCPGWMLHIARGIDTTIEEYRGALWRHRVLGFYRYRPPDGNAAGAAA
ncbi:MAG: C40 family peptidase [Hyphomicrobiaceae bacterium]